MPKTWLPVSQSNRSLSRCKGIEKDDDLHVHRPQSACYLLRPSADVEHAGMQIDPRKKITYWEHELKQKIIKLDRWLTSITQSINTVSANHITNTTAKPILPTIPSHPKANSTVIDHKTSESWAWARDKAHNRRYEAVCEIHPRQNSMVWITWCTTTSLKSCCS